MRRKKEEELFTLFHCFLTMEEAEQCSNVLEQGVPNDQVPGTYPVILKPSMNCTFVVDGKIAYVAPPEDPEKAIAFIKELPIIHGIEDFIADESDTDPEFIVPDGVYLWVLYKAPGKQNFSWAFRKVRSILEVGTLHKSIARAVGAATIHAAGEIEKRAGELIINYLSGSYMLNACNRRAKEVIMDELFSETIGQHTSFSFTDQTLIVAQPTMDELRYYASKGFRICLHEPDKVAECKATKGTCENILKPQEGAMRGGDENLMIQGKAIQPASQASKARQVFASQGLIARPKTPKEKALTELAKPITPASVGLGRKRKTRRGKAKKSKKTLKKKL